METSVAREFIFLASLASGLSSQCARKVTIADLFQVYPVSANIYLPGYQVTDRCGRNDVHEIVASRMSQGSEPIAQPYEREAQCSET
jgi:hypothetical protein